MRGGREGATSSVACSLLLQTLSHPYSPNLRNSFDAASSPKNFPKMNLFVYSHFKIALILITFTFEFGNGNPCNRLLLLLLSRARALALGFYFIIIIIIVFYSRERWSGELIWFWDLLENGRNKRMKYAFWLCRFLNGNNRYIEKM